MGARITSYNVCYTKLLRILGFGAMRLPVDETTGQIKEQKAIDLMRRAIDNGVNYLDTAWPYHGGQSEVIVGKALKAGYRDKVKIATKLPSWAITSREHMDEILNSQLEKLGIKTIVITSYSIHYTKLYDAIARSKRVA